MKTEFPEIFALSVEKKIELLGELWDSIAESPANVVIPGWQIEELDRRREEYERNPGIGMTWDEVEQQILSEHEQQAHNPAAG